MRLRFLIFILVFLVAVFFFGFIDFYKKIKNYKTYDKLNIQAIAVLTGGKGRIDKGLNLFKKIPNSFLLISGVDKNIKSNEIIPEELLKNKKVFIDRKSQTTLDNAEQIIKWAKNNNIANVSIITSDYHMPRSMLILLKKSKNINFYANPVKSDLQEIENIFNNFGLLVFLSEEYLKFLFYYLLL